MSRFRYLAARPDGSTEAGELDADSERMARQLLRQRGLLALQIEAGSRARHRAGRVTDEQLAWSIRQLASLVESGLPLTEAIDGVAQESEGRALQARLAAVGESLRAGNRLAQAFESLAGSRSRLLVAMVDAGEQTGRLAEVLAALADWLEGRNALRSRLLAAFLYPALVSLISAAIVLFLLVYVVPQVAEAFTQSRQSLPWLTQAMMALSGWLAQYGLWLIPGLGAVVLGLRWLLQQPALALRWHAARLDWPLWGRIERQLEMSRFATTLAILTASGVPMLRALATASETVANRHLRKALGEVSREVSEGMALSAALKRSRCFAPVMIQLVATGERSGTLPLMLDRVARSTAQQLERRALALAALVEPLLIVLMGAFVLLIVLAVLMPIIEINQLVR